MGSFRCWSAALFFCALLAGCVALLWQAQVEQGEAYWAKSQQNIAGVERVPAARGRLMDRTGQVLAADTIAWRGLVAEGMTEEERTQLHRLCWETETRWDGGAVIREASQALMLRVEEVGLAGVTFAPMAIRQGSGTLAAHTLGRTGPMDSTQWAYYQTRGYGMDETVGQEGAEAAFEDVLHGTGGKQVVARDRDGEVTGIIQTVAPQAGRDVVLTLDRRIQQATENALADALEQTSGGAGAAVILNVGDGAVLAMASLPAYDPAEFSADYAALLADPGAPLVNRAIQGTYAPGSVLKLVTAAAALEEGILTPETQILDTGVYTYYDTPQPQCWLYRQKGETHGPETVAEAIAHSCNVFFYDVGRRLGIGRLEQYERAFGLGAPTGIELAGEEAGVIAGPAASRQAGGVWYEGSVLSAAIGQENNRFTPLQLAEMTAVLVNGGNRWQTHLLQQVRGEEPYQKTLLSRLNLSEATVQAVKEGMGAVTRSEEAKAFFSALPVTAGGKTGSVQVAGRQKANGVFVAFAPYEEPEVALAIVVEEGGSGMALAASAARMLAACFD